VVHPLQDPGELKLVGVVTFLSIEVEPVPRLGKAPRTVNPFPGCYVSAH
jgi:hypothetical protein